MSRDDPEDAKRLTCGCIMTLRGAVVGWDPTPAGPKGRARCRKDSPTVMIWEEADIVFSIWISTQTRGSNAVVDVSGL